MTTYYNKENEELFILPEKSQPITDELSYRLANLETRLSNVEKALNIDVETQIVNELEARLHNLQTKFANDTLPEYYSKQDQLFV